MVARVSVLCGRRCRPQRLVYHSDQSRQKRIAIAFAKVMSPQTNPKNIRLPVVVVTHYVVTIVYCIVDVLFIYRQQKVPTVASLCARIRSVSRRTCATTLRKLLATYSLASLEKLHASTACVVLMITMATTATPKTSLRVSVQEFTGF